DYVIAYADDGFTVQRAPLTVTADGESRMYGAHNPPLTATLSGFVLGEDASATYGAPNCTTTATSTSMVADYPITCTAGTLQADNYAFTTFVDGTLRVLLAETATSATPAVLQVSPLGVYAFTLHATVTRTDTHTAVSGVPVAFSAGGGPVCG